jgi:hypothetical protein
MVLLVGAVAGTHQAAAMIQQSLSIEARQTILDILEDGVDEMVSVADRLVSVSQYFYEDVAAMHARLVLEQLDEEDEEPSFLVTLESELTDTGMGDDGVTVVQFLWVLSVLIVMPRTSDEEPPFLIEIPDLDLERIQHLLEDEIRMRDLTPDACYPMLFHESAIPNEWYEFVEAIAREAASTGTVVSVGEAEGSIMEAAAARAEFMRLFPMEVALVDDIFDLLPTSTISSTFYPYQDFLAIHGHQDDEQGEMAYGEYLGARALQLAQLQAAARKRGLDIEFRDVIVTAKELFDWLESEGLENTPVNRSQFAIRDAKEQARSRDGDGH